MSRRRAANNQALYRLIRFFNSKAQRMHFSDELSIKKPAATANGIHEHSFCGLLDVMLPYIDSRQPGHDALSTPLSGNFNNGSANNQGSNGNFWSSTRNNDNNMYNLNVNSSNVNPQNNNNRNNGNSVRCLLQ